MVSEMGAPATAVRAHEEMFAYWASMRGGQKFPARAQLDPDHIKRHLPHVSLIDVYTDKTTGKRSYRQRLAGTGLYSVYGREITGQPLEEVYAPPAATYWRDELDKVVEAGRPGVGFHSLAWRGQSHMSLLWLRLGYDALVGGSSENSISGIRAA